MHTFSRRQAIRGAVRALTGVSLAGATPLAALLASPAEAQLGGLFGTSKPPFGVALNRWALADDTQRAAYTASIKRYARLIVPEDGLYWEQLRPARDKFDFTVGDKLLAFAETHRLPFRGHTLVWHGAMPKWTEGISSPKEAERELVGHIERVVGHYKGRITAWNAVNEMIDDKPTPDQPLRPSVWFRQLGERYLDIALKTIKQVDPAAQLLINDFGIEAVDPVNVRRREALLALTQRLRDRYAPFSGVGIQAHVSGEQAIDKPGLTQFCADVKKLDLDIFVTELDVGDQKLPADVEVRDAICAVRAWDLLDAVFEGARPREVYTWGLSDRYTWMPMWFKRADGLDNRCLPLDKDYRPKPMLKVVEHFCRMAG